MDYIIKLKSASEISGKTMNLYLSPIAYALPTNFAEIFQKFVCKNAGNEIE